MKRKQLHPLLYALLLCFLFVSCKGQPNLVHIPAFNGIKLYMTQKQFNAYADSLVNNDPIFNAAWDKNQRYLEFSELSDYGFTYKGYVLPTYTNGILTKLTIFYTPNSSPESVTKYTQRKEQTLMYWGDAVNKVQNDINLKLQIKYGVSTKSGSMISPHAIANYTYLFQEWKKENLSVKLLQEIEKDDGSNRFIFCNYLVEYSPTEEFLIQNKKTIEQIIRNNGMY